VTLNKIKSIYRSFFRWIRETGRSAYDPAAHLSFAKTSSVSTIPISAEEVGALLATIRSTKSLYAERDEALFATYAFAGLRRSEALSLQIADYDQISRLLTLRHTKGGGSRVLPVPNILAEVLERYIHGMKPTTSADRSFFLFPGRRPQAPLSARQAQTRFDKWKSKIGLRNSLKIHSFRAGFATRLYRATGDLWLVGRALGHSNLHTTQRYVATDESDIRAAMEKTFESVRVPTHTLFLGVGRGM
jgi:site-specific recombinase XerD